MDTFTHKCPNCDGPLLFDPKDQKFHCEYCLSVFTEAEVTTYETAQRNAHLENETPDQAMAAPKHVEQQSDAVPLVNKATDAKQQEATSSSTLDAPSEEAEAAAMELFTCPSCGAQIVTDATTAATYCYYCHNPVVLSGRLSGEFLPEKVLPFAVEKEEAIERFLTWTKKKWFVPRDFFNKQQIDKMTGVYFPYWIIDATLNGQMNALGTAIRVWRVGDIEYTETKQFDVQRSGNMSFSDLTKNALSKNIQQKMVEAVQPFHLDKAVSFKSQYLAGFQAEKRDINYETLKETVEDELKSYAESLLKDTTSGYTTLTNVQSYFSLENQQNHYMLLPIWLVTYHGSDSSKKVYYYAMNGQTGKVSGVLPISYKRLGIFTLAIFTVVLLLFLIGGWFI